jgi:NAD(P)-dependent dehydrogenase (short-subunit alcohol dehydrogenase family)/acyl carrier protein
VRTFPFGAAAEAFRVMAHAGHVGKLALRAPRAIERGGDVPLVHADATYLITGGTGGLGLRTARWLVERGARHLVLTGRRALAPQAQSSVDDLVAHGARVEVRLVDAVDESAMSALCDEIDRTMPALRGVVHAAGTIDQGLLARQTWPRWRAALSGKAAGARVLDAVTRRHDLDFFVLYSSVSTWLGPVGQGAYVAANAELDAIAWARRSQGLPALSVSWGQYRDAGMAVRMLEEGLDPWSARGLGWLTSDAAFARLERLLRTGATHALVSPIDWRQFLSRLPGGVSRSFFARVAPADRAAAPARATLAPAGSTNGHATVDAWRAAPSRERLDLVRAFVAERARQVIGLTDDTAIDPRVALKDVGLDSLMAVELRNVLTRALATPLPATLLFDYPTLDAIVKLLDDTWQLSTPPAGAPVSGDAAVAEIAALSDAEAEAQLLAELDQPSGRTR